MLSRQPSTIVPMIMRRHSREPNRATMAMPNSEVLNSTLAAWIVVLGSMEKGAHSTDIPINARMVRHCLTSSIAELDLMMTTIARSSQLALTILRKSDPVNAFVVGSK